MAQVAAAINKVLIPPQSQKVPLTFPKNMPIKKRIKKAIKIENSSGAKGRVTPHISNKNGDIIKREIKKGAKPFTMAIKMGIIPAALPWAETVKSDTIALSRALSSRRRSAVSLI